MQRWPCVISSRVWNRSSSEELTLLTACNTLIGLREIIWNSSMYAKFRASESQTGWYMQYPPLIKQFVFVVEKQWIICEAGTEFLSTVYVNSSLKS
jgi:hypothetical protein